MSTIISECGTENHQQTESDSCVINWGSLNDGCLTGVASAAAAEESDITDAEIDADAAATINEHRELGTRYGTPPTYTGRSAIIALLIGSLAAGLSDDAGYAKQLRATESQHQPNATSITSRLPEWADRYMAAGLSIIPVTEGKKPTVSWKPYQDTRATPDEVKRWIADPSTLGFGIVGGKVSGNLEIIDIDDGQARQDYLELLQKAGPDLLARLIVVETPKGGLHLYYRCEQIEGNQRLAMAEEEGQGRVLIETRGEGGYVVAPGSDPRVHPLNKPYRVQQGDFANIPELTLDQRNTLLELARSLNQQIKASPVDEQLNRTSKGDPDHPRPGDEFNQQATWEEVLTPFGWHINHHAKGVTYWTRPGKTRGVSASTNYAGCDKLIVFSTSTSFETETTYSKFAAYAVLNHKGNYSKAAADLAKQGYGEPGAGGMVTHKQSSLLVALAKDAELFNFKREGYATVPVDQHQETYRLNSSGFRLWLSRQFYVAHKTTPSSTAMDEAILALTGTALFVGKTLPVNVRVAGDRDRIYLDLANDKWQVVEIDAGGWRILDQSPVKFIRPDGMEPLPTPTRGGSLQDLRSLVNVQSDQDWLLLLSWLEYCLTPNRGYPILAISGEQGSAKSTTSRVLRRLVDNNRSLLRSMPKDDQNLAVTAENSWLLAFDNLSGIKADMSDLLCSVCTGGGFATRKLYADREEMLFEYCRPILLNGISDVLIRPDILDRTISINLPAIDEIHRRCEDEIWNDFDQKAGGILGALLDVISQGVSRRGQVQLPEKPRMADFAVFATACEQANGSKDGEFLAAYSQNCKEAQDGLVDGDIVASPLLEWAFRLSTGQWTGTYKDLLLYVQGEADELARDKFFPKTAKALSNAVKRLAPVLRKRGVTITQLNRAHGGKRMIEVTVQKPAG